MRVLIADKFQQKYLGDLEALGHEITLNADLTADDIVGAIIGYDVLIVRSTKVTAPAIAASDRLSLIIRAGAGVNTIDIKAAAQKGIFVCNCPGKNAIAVAEVAFGLLVSIDRRIPDNVIELRNGKWNKKKYGKADGLFGKTIAVLGLGEIGLAFAERAAAFGMDVLAIDKPRNAENQRRLENINTRFISTQEALLAQADVISIHLPSNDQTKHMVNKAFLSHVRVGAIIINTSRGNIIDDHALLEAIEAQQLRVGLDVYNNEPTTGQCDFDNTLAKHAAVYGTHHIGASTEQAQNAIACDVIDILKQYGEGNIINTVNVQEYPEVTHTITVRHYDRVGVLAAVLTVLREDKVNIEQMRNMVFSGGEAACATLFTNREPQGAALEKLEAIEDVISVTVKSS